jgi:cellulose synthase/poly-beta-1,6-N-acetylglucosamine synthase-like glycosyltransferase
VAVAIDIAVIIPSNHGHRELLEIVRAVCSQSIKPAEVVIVDSSVESGKCPNEIITLCSRIGTELKYEQSAKVFPGQARNIGLGIARSDWIAFVDVQTLPQPHWLETYMNLLASHNADGIFGATNFKAQTVFEMLARDGFYGVKPRNTLPGSIFKSEVFQRVGQFINWVRAGEDTEWILRLGLLKVPVIYSSNALLDYVGLIGSSPRTLMKKWFRNYSASRELPHFFPHKLLLWLVIYPILIVLAFNWNYLIADWRIDSPLYIGHLTKIVTVFPVIAYILVRGLLLPFHRGVEIYRLLPIRFIGIVTVCAIGDAVKVLVFTLPRRSKNLSV